jgi:hypothetical protein
MADEQQTQQGGDLTDVVVPITVDEALEVLRHKADEDE